MYIPTYAYVVLVVVIIMVAISFYVGGVERTALGVLPGVALFVAGLLFSASGAEIFIGAMLVGAFLFLLGFYNVVMRRQ